MTVEVATREMLACRMAINNIDLSRILSLIIGVLTDPYDKFIEKLQGEGRITEQEVQELRQALKDQLPKLSELVRPPSPEEHKL